MTHDGRDRSGGSDTTIVAGPCSGTDQLQSHRPQWYSIQDAALVMMCSDRTKPTVWQCAHAVWLGMMGLIEVETSRATGSIRENP